MIIATTLAAKQVERRAKVKPATNQLRRAQRLAQRQLFSSRTARRLDRTTHRRQKHHRKSRHQVAEEVAAVEIRFLREKSAADDVRLKLTRRLLAPSRLLEANDEHPPHLSHRRSVRGRKMMEKWSRLSSLPVPCICTVDVTDELNSSDGYRDRRRKIHY